MITIFSASSLLLSAVGIYGVMSYTVGQRRREIGIRIALGAQKRDVARLVIGNGMVMVAVAIVVGVVGAFALTRFMSGMLFGVEAADLSTLCNRGNGASQRGIMCMLRPGSPGRKSESSRSASF